MGGFSGDWAYGAYDRGARRRRRRVTPPRVEPKIFTATAVIPHASSTDGEAVGLIQERLHAQAVQHLDTYGYVGTQLRFTADPPMDPTAPVTLRLEVEMLPREDGEWPAIHQAIAEDEADRAEALADKTTVEERLDALKASSGVWRASTFAEVSKAANEAAETLRRGFARVGAAARLPVDLTTAEAESTDTSSLP